MQASSTTTTTFASLPQAHRRLFGRLVRASPAFAEALPATSWADLGIGTPGQQDTKHVRLAY
jgi:hypothetical protein